MQKTRPKSSTQCQNSATASTASFAERWHRLPHAPLPPELGSSSSKPYSLYNFPTQGTIKRKKIKNNSYVQVLSFSCFAAIAFTSQLAFCCSRTSQSVPFTSALPRAVLPPGGQYLEQFRSRCQFSQFYLQVKTFHNLHLQQLYLYT